MTQLRYTPTRNSFLFRFDRFFGFVWKFVHKSIGFFNSLPVCSNILGSIYNGLAQYINIQFFD
jgi:hypothetical protein